MSELEKILNDDLLKCEIVESVENAARRVDLIKWTHDGLFSVADLRKDTGKLEISESRRIQRPQSIECISLKIAYGLSSLTN